MPNVGNLTAKLTLDTKGFSDGAKGAIEQAQNLAGKIGGIMSGVAASVGAIAAASAAGVANIVKQSVESFANYEQLVGGVETLFKDSADIVEQYANEAYKTAGISVNEYMETITSFSASLLQSLGGNTAEAAEIANMAIIDMSDNANKMGTSMESIQMAYQGFAKQNYTMLDNLKLGYGGTRSEMERLLADAEKLTGIKYDITNLADVYNAIHAIQHELGITGTTAEEASTTITGSWNMVKASWQNLLTSIAGGGQGLETTIGNFVTSVTTWFQNLVPVVQTALLGVANLITGLAPTIVAVIPTLVSTLIPAFMSAVMTIVEAIVGALPMIVTTIVSALIGILPDFITAFISVLDMLMLDIIPMLLQAAMDIVTALAEGLLANQQLLIDGFVSLLLFVTDFVGNNLMTIIMLGLQIIAALVDGLLANMPKLIDAIVGMIDMIVTSFIDYLPQFLEIGGKIILQIAYGIVLAIPMLLYSIGQVLGIFDKTKETVSRGTNDIRQMTDQTAASTESSLNAMQQQFGQTQKAAELSGKTLTTLTQDTEKQASKYGEQIVMTAQRVDQQVNNFIVGGVMVTFASALNQLGEFYDNFSRVIDNAKEKLESLGDMSVGPEVDANGVTKGCSEIVAACESAISALTRLGSASAGGGGGFGGGRASGGYISAGSSYLVGELGPELITPTRSGYVHNADETAMMASAAPRQTIININGDVYDDERSMRQKVKTAVMGILEEQMAYG